MNGIFETKNPQATSNGNLFLAKVKSGVQTEAQECHCHLAVYFITTKSVFGKGQDCSVDHSVI
jgi:hypothetical protein